MDLVGTGDLVPAGTTLVTPGLDPLDIRSQNKFLSLIPLSITHPPDSHITSE